MNLVSAKCPSCGANLKVDPNIEAINCEYCKQTIIVNDAINKYKVEITGEMEVKNIPKLANLQKIAERYYTNKEFDKAYDTYDEIIKLDPDNIQAILRYSICKALINNYIDFTLEHLTNTFKTVVKMLETNGTKQDIQKYLTEIEYAIKKSRNSTIEYYNSYAIPLPELLEVQKKLYSCLELEEELINYVPESDQERKALDIISLIDDLEAEKIYKSGTNEYGNNINEEYVQSTYYTNLYSEKREKYLSMLSPNAREEIERKISEKKSKETNSNKPTKEKTKMTILDIFIGLIIIIALSHGYIFCAFTILLLLIVIKFTNEDSKIFKEHPQYRKIIIISLSIILFIFMMLHT